jgi:hypothetical protein
MKRSNLLFLALALCGFGWCLSASIGATSCKCADGARLLQEFRFFTSGFSFVELTVLTTLLIKKGIRSYALLSLLFLTPFVVLDWLNSASVSNHGHVMF